MGAEEPSSSFKRYIRSVKINQLSVKVLGQGKTTLGVKISRT